MKRSDYMRRNTWQPNPPKKAKKRRTKKSRSTPSRAPAGRGRATGAASARPRKTSKRAPRRAAAVQAFKLGVAMRLTYRHSRDGTNRYHDFPRGTVVGYTPDRKFLIIPAKVQEFIS